MPDEFGAACAFLCSAHAGYITGQNLLIDGGDLSGRVLIAPVSFRAPPSQGLRASATCYGGEPESITNE